MNLPRVSQNVRDPDFVQNPYPFYARCRDLGDIVWWEELERPAAVSWQAVNALMRDRRFGRSVPEDLRDPVPESLGSFYAVEQHSLLQLDGAPHAAIRGQVLRAFTSGRVAGLEPEITALARRLADSLSPGDDLLTNFATPIPLTVIARLLGVPDADGAQLLDWSHAMCRMYLAAPPAADQIAAENAAADFAEYLRHVLHAKRRSPGDDLASALLSDGRLNEAEMISTLVLLLNAGHEATVHALGNSIRLLCQTEAEDWEDAVEECLRYDPPLHLFDRVAQEDCEVLGLPLKRGDWIACLLGSAGRDQAAFANPDSFLPDRGATRHLAFGVGAHFCIGAPLARLEMRVALRVLFERWPDLRVRTPGYADAWHFHGLERLEIESL